MAMTIKVAIIGTRKPDPRQSALAAEAADYLSRHNCIISTGGAYGIDKVAMVNTFDPSSRLIVYLPWASYNSTIIPHNANHVVYSPKIHITWKESVTKYHPYPGVLTSGAISLHARNYGIVEGCKLVLAFPDEKGEGGTGQGIRIVKGMNIPLVQINRGSNGIGVEGLRVILDKVLEDKYGTLG